MNVKTVAKYQFTPEQIEWANLSVKERKKRLKEEEKSYRREKQLVASSDHWQKKTKYYDDDSWDDLDYHIEDILQ